VQLCRPGLEAHTTVRPMLVTHNDRTAKPVKRAVFMYNSNGVLLWKGGTYPTTYLLPCMYFCGGEHTFLKADWLQCDVNNY